MIFVTALCPECGNEPEDSVCEICGYEGEKYGWALQTLYLPNNRVHADELCRECGIVLRESDLEAGECFEHQYARQ